MLIIMTDLSVNKPNLAFVLGSASEIGVQISVSTPEADPRTQKASLFVVFKTSHNNNRCNYNVSQITKNISWGWDHPHGSIFTDKNI